MKVKKCITFEKDVYEEILKWRAKQYEKIGDIPSFSKAVNELVKKGLKRS